jgi:hypothetical protein
MIGSYEHLQQVITTDLHELQSLKKRRWWVWPMERVVKEEHIGRCCYLAEEMLSCADLHALKEEIGLSEQQWRAYKTKISG